MRNKEGAACARAMLQIAQQANLRQYGSVLQSDNDPSFESDVASVLVSTAQLLGRLETLYHQLWFRV